MIAGQLIGGVLTDTVGWRWAFGFVCLLYETRGALMVFGLAASVMLPLGAVFAVLLRQHHRRTA